MEPSFEHKALSAEKQELMQQLKDRDYSAIILEACKVHASDDPEGFASILNGDGFFNKNIQSLVNEAFDDGDIKSIEDADREARRYMKVYFALQRGE